VSLCIALVVYLMDVGATPFRGAEFILYASIISFVEVALLFVIGFIVLIAKIDGSKLKISENNDVLDAPKQRMNHKEVARSFFLAGGLILLIGTSMCFGGFFGVF
jgi:hypothetical protein